MLNRFAMPGFLFGFLWISLGVAHAATSIDLLTPGNLKVGEVQISNDSSSLYVKYVITNDPAHPENSWCLRATSLKVARTAAELFAQAAQNATQNCVSEYTYTLPKVWSSGTTLFISAQAQVEKSGADNGASINLPATALLTISPPVSGGPSYFTSTITEGGILNGTYPGWCVDNHHTIYSYSPVTVDVLSSIRPVPTGLLDHPERLILANWILAQSFVGKTSPGGFGTYTYGDVQRAIWSLVSDTLSTSGIGTWNANRVSEIVAAALIQGPSYKPGCNDPIAVLLVPREDSGVVNAQITIAVVTLTSVGYPCTSETALAGIRGISIPRKDGQQVVYGTYVVQ